MRRKFHGSTPSTFAYDLVALQLIPQVHALFDHGIVLAINIVLGRGCFHRHPNLSF